MYLNIEYDVSRAHGALYDAQRSMHVFEQLRNNEIESYYLGNLLNNYSSYTKEISDEEIKNIFMK